MMSKMNKSGICGRLLQPAAKLLGPAGALAVLAGIAPGFAIAQTAGSLDSTFGTQGIVTTTPTTLGGSTTALTAIEESNGDLAVVAGISIPSAGAGDEVFGLMRYTPSGTLIGTTTATFVTNGLNVPSAVAVQPNGDIVVVGTASTGFDQADEIAIARFTPSGQLDSTFGKGGLVTTTLPANPHFTTGLASVTAVLAQPNGQILVGGFVGSCCRNSPPATVLVRYNSNGGLDTTFGTGGIVMVPNAVTDPAALALLSNGDYLAVSPGAVVEFSSTGALQPAVTLGTVEAAIRSGSGTAVFQPNGDYVVAQIGPGVGRRGTDAQVFRFSETGVADSTFSSTPFAFGGNTQTEPQAIALQSNGQIVVGGLTNARNTPITGGLARLDSNGELDATFAGGGSLASTQVVSGLLIQTDGKIVAIGGIGANLALARYLSN
jgi:uncharacterized delta-60 repeat protein